MPAMADELRIEVVAAWPGRHVRAMLELPAGATVGDAVDASGLPMDGIAGFAVFGVHASRGTALVDGDRVELLRPLTRDPKESRRLRAAAPAGGRGKRPA